MVHLLWYAAPALVAAVVAFALTPLVARLAVLIGAIDVPDARKVHTVPIPRLGGLAVVASIAAVLVGSTWLSGGRWRLTADLAPGLAFGVLPVLVVSILDDIESVGAGWKFLAHALGATIAVWCGISLAPVVHLFGTAIQIGFLAAPLSVLWIVGVTNAFNIIDGLDGLSAGLALIAAMSMAAVFALTGQAQMAAVALVLAGGLAGFLPYNTYPARLFLGDTGSTAIGFCLAAFALKGGSTLSSGFAALLPVFILGLPIADTVISIMRRTIGRLENHTGGVLVPDRNHIHHRLLALGVDHGRAVLILYGAGLVSAGAAFASVFLSARDAAFIVIALLVSGFIGVHRLGYNEFAFLKRGTILNVYRLPVVRRGMFVVYRRYRPRGRRCLPGGRVEDGPLELLHRPARLPGSGDDVRPGDGDCLLVVRHVSGQLARGGTRRPHARLQSRGDRHRRRRRARHLAVGRRVLPCPCSASTASSA